MRLLALVLLSALTLGSVTAPAYAAPCRDSHGRFAKCSTVQKATRCRDAKGRFAKCGSAGSHPA